MLSGESGLTDETSHVESTRKKVAEGLSLGAVVETEPRRALEVTTGLVGIPAFGIAEPADTQFPGRGIDL